MADEKKVSIELTLNELDELCEFLEHAYGYCVDSRWMERAEKVKLLKKGFKAIATKAREMQAERDEDTEDGETDES